MEPHPRILWEGVFDVLKNGDTLPRSTIAVKVLSTSILE
jgi:hypothetical protein